MLPQIFLSERRGVCPVDTWATPPRSSRTGSRCRISRTPTSRPFRYFDKGNMAIVGKGFAVLQSGRIRVSGFLAWLAWAAVHLEFLAQSSLRVSVFVQWVWTYLTGQRGSRLIVAHRASPGLGFLAKPEP